jgi:hypothetical protein
MGRRQSRTAVGFQEIQSIKENSVHRLQENIKIKPHPSKCSLRANRKIMEKVLLLGGSQHLQAVPVENLQHERRVLWIEENNKE